MSCSWPRRREPHYGMDFWVKWGHFHAWRAPKTDKETFLLGEWRVLGWHTGQCRASCRHSVTAWKLLLPGISELEVAGNLDRASQMRKPQPGEVDSSPRDPQLPADPQLKIGKCGLRVGLIELHYPDLNPRKLLKLLMPLFPHLYNGDN